MLNYFVVDDGSGDGIAIACVVLIVAVDIYLTLSIIKNLQQHNEMKLLTPTLKHIQTYTHIQYMYTQAYKQIFDYVGLVNTEANIIMACKRKCMCSYHTI